MFTRCQAGNGVSLVSRRPVLRLPCGCEDVNHEHAAAPVPVRGGVEPGCGDSCGSNSGIDSKKELFQGILT